MTEIEFEKALRKGLGRCVLALNNKADLNKYKKVLLKCCTHNISEYVDLEKSRGEFLYRLVKKYEQDDFFVEPVVPIYKNIDRLTKVKYKLFAQMTDFLWCFAKEKNTVAREALDEKFPTIIDSLCDCQKSVLETKNAFELMGHKIIENDGFPGFVKVMFAVDDICQCNEAFSFDDFAEVLEVGRMKFRISMILDELSSRTSRKMYNYFYISYRKRTGFLNKPTTQGGRGNFCQTRDNYNATDFVPMEDLTIDPDVFATCRRLVSIHEEEKKSKAPKELLMFLYENSPSSYMRARVVEYLGKKKLITKELATECLHDCNEDIVKYIRQHHNYLFK